MRSDAPPKADLDGVIVDDLTVRFPRAGRDALSGIDLHLPPGERVLLLGPSGSGKSTLLRVLAGVVPHSIHASVTGRVIVAGRHAASTPVPELSDRVATMTQSPADQLCLPAVLDELAFPLENRRVPPEKIGPRIVKTLRAVGAGHLIRRRTAELSGGEGQKVALAAALSPDPQVVLLDEPTAHLDSRGVTQVGNAIAADGRSRRTMVLVEHRLDELPWLPERVLILDAGGSVAVEGITAEVLHSHGPALASDGVWLPYETELELATGLTEPADQAEALSRTVGRRPPSTPGEVIRRAETATVFRDGAATVTGVDLELRRGQVTAIIGPNGSGKTTLLLGLAGLLPATGVTGGTVGMVFQNPEHQFLTRSARDEIRYGHASFPAVDEALARFDLDGLGDADPFRLSGGQQRRLSLAVMALQDRDVLLADEPTFGQDRNTTQAVASALTEIAGTGRAVAVATHDLRLVARIADRVVVLDRGQVRLNGDTERILRSSDLLDAVGLSLPPLLRWLLRSAPEVQLRDLVTGLDEMVCPSC